MPITVLATKFYCPPVRETLVSRPRLVQRLKEGINRPLVLISAPAGYGKTTLLSEWRASLGSDYPLAWLTLDQEDNDPVRFLTYFICALRRLKPDLGEAALSTLQSPRPPSPETILTSILIEISEHDQPFVLVLDDYHVIEEPQVHAGITFLLDHLPPWLYLVILTRTDPPLPLSRLRARDQVSEIRADDLRFTNEEVDLFLNQVMRLGLSEENLRILEQSTEGWIAGLQLAALSMQGRTDLHQFISSFKGSYHYIADYLVDEVLNRQADEVKAFLMKTSILERLNGSLCDALTGAADGQATLEKLEHHNLFIVPLDDEQKWYRYHHLFSELLQNRLWREFPSMVPELYGRAANWCNGNGLAPEAIMYAMESGEFEQAARLIDQNIPQMQKRGELRTLSGWLSKLPEEVICTQPRMCIAYAWAVAYSLGSPDKVERYLQYAEQVLSTMTPTPDTQDLLGQIASIRANVAVFMGDNPRAIELCKLARKLLSESNAALRSYTALMEADASWMMGDGKATQSALEDAIRICRYTGDLQTALTSMNYLARVLIAHGHLRQAHAIYQDALQLASDLGGHSWPATGIIYVGIGMLKWELNEPQAAMDYLNRGIELAKQADDVDSLLFGYTTLARINQAGGYIDQAHEMFERAERVSQETNLARDKYRVAARQAGLLLARGDIEGATHWSKELTENVIEYFHDTPIPDLSPLHISEQIMQARIMIAQENPAEATQLLAQLLLPLEAAGRMRSVVEVLALQAIALQAQGELMQAMTTLARALVIAEPEGFTRLFVDEGKPIAQLLSRLQAKGMGNQAYVSRLLAAFEPAEIRSEIPPSPRITPSKYPIVEALSERELEVLRLIAIGCSNSDIAKELVIAIGTVKRHTANIFNKLDVRNRTEAVARARELGFI